MWLIYTLQQLLSLPSRFPTPLFANPSVQMMTCALYNIIRDDSTFIETKQTQTSETQYIYVCSV